VRCVPLAAQRGEARLRRVLGAEHAERERPAIRPVVLHDEVIVDRKAFSSRPNLSAAGRPPCGGMKTHQPALSSVRPARAVCKRERLERLFGARRIGEREAAPFEAFQRERAAVVVPSRRQLRSGRSP